MSADVLPSARTTRRRVRGRWPQRATVWDAALMPRTDSASRVVKAAVQRVFAALLDPDQLAEWLPPRGMTGRLESFDPRPGGSYRLVPTYEGVTSCPGKASADSDIVEA